MTAAADPIELKALQARTGSGELWTSASGALVRLIDPRVCDSQFRRALDRLRQRNYPSMVPVASTGWLGMKFCIQYQLQERWKPFTQHWEPLHWRLRLPILKRICDLLPEWAHAAGYPVGISPANIVVVELAGQWFPWLLPCPPVAQSSPLEFLECDPQVLACVPPETIRGVALDGRAQDAYGLGSLVWEALGSRAASEQWSAAERLEAQACGWLLTRGLEATAIEPFLQALPDVQSLARMAARHTQTDVMARPVTTGDLSKSCDSAFKATDPQSLARQFFDAGRLPEALKVVDWGLATHSASLPLYELGAESAENARDFERAIGYLDHAVQLVPWDLGLRFRRCDARWRLFRGRELAGPAATANEEILLQDLELSKSLREDSRKSEPYRRRASIFQWRGDLHAAAQELYDGTEAEQSDIQVAYEYAKVLRALEQPELVRAACAECLRRTDLMVKAGMMFEIEATKWRDLFSSLL